jgi:hypothetical protein
MKFDFTILCFFLIYHCAAQLSECPNYYDDSINFEYAKDSSLLIQRFDSQKVLQVVGEQTYQMSFKLNASDPQISSFQGDIYVSFFNFKGMNTLVPNTQCFLNFSTDNFNSYQNIYIQWEDVGRIESFLGAHIRSDDGKIEKYLLFSLKKDNLDPSFDNNCPKFSSSPKYQNSSNSGEWIKSSTTLTSIKQTEEENLFSFFIKLGSESLSRNITSVTLFSNENIDVFMEGIKSCVFQGGMDYKMVFLQWKESSQDRINTNVTMLLEDIHGNTTVFNMPVSRELYEY